MNKKVDVAVIGAGHAGLNAIKEIRKVTDNYVLINGGELGTTCARIGCMPSKVAIQLAEVYQSRKQYAKYGISGGDAVQIDPAEALEHVRDMRDTFVDLVLANTTDEMDEEKLLQGYAEFLDPHTLKVGNRIVEAAAVVIATGSHSVVPAQWQEYQDELLTVENLFEQASLPESVAVIGLGPIGLEMGLALHHLGVDVVGIERGPMVARCDDPEVNRVAIETFGRHFPLWTGEEAVVERRGERYSISAGEQSREVDKLLVAMGRRPNLGGMGLERLGVPLNRLGVPDFDPFTLQVGELPIYIAGDVTGVSATLQQAADQGRMPATTPPGPTPPPSNPRPGCPSSSASPTSLP